MMDSGGTKSGEDERSEEERDNLARSTKKVKTAEGC